MNNLFVYTIGHGARKKDQFLKLLKEYNIQVLIDVRRWPSSKISHFCKEDLEKWLSDFGISYIWLGDSLGGYRKGGYEKYMTSKAFLNGVNQILQIAKRNRVCLMCLEISPKFCHRRFISSYLNKLGVSVIHILSEDKLEIIK